MSKSPFKICRLKKVDDGWMKLGLGCLFVWTVCFQKNFHAKLSLANIWVGSREGCIFILGIEERDDICAEE